MTITDDALWTVPQDLPAERAVLGSVIWQGEKLLGRITLAGGDFYRPDHGELWSVIAGLRRGGVPIDPTSVNSAVRTNDRLAKLVLDVVTEHRYGAIGAEHHAQAVADTALRRRVVEAGQRMMQRAQGPAEITELVAAAADDIAQIADGIRHGDAVPAFTDALATAMDVWEHPDRRVQPTGWPDFDDILSGGLRPGHLCIVGARPAIGKSLVASMVARQVAERGVGVLVASMEMTRHELVSRITAASASVSLTELTRGEVSTDSWERIAQRLPRLDPMPLFIDDTSSQTVTHIAAAARDARRRHGLGLVVVDYLQLVRPADRAESRQQAVAGVARGLKLLARDLDVPVVALAQVNRRPEQSLSKRPSMADLRESGEIENSADEVVVLHRDEKDELMAGLIEFLVEKNRHGRTGKVDMVWSPHLGRIDSLERGAP